jgi:hypothetical protein
VDIVLEEGVEKLAAELLEAALAHAQAKLLGAAHDDKLTKCSLAVHDGASLDLRYDYAHGAYTLRVKGKEVTYLQPGGRHHDTLLHIAVRGARGRLLEWLALHPGLDTTVVNDEGHTAEALARDLGGTTWELFKGFKSARDRADGASPQWRAEGE